MKKDNFKILTALLLGAVVVWFLMDRQNTQFISTLEDQLDDQAQVMHDLAEMTDRNQTDGAIERVITKCSSEDQSRFDSNLDSLLSLTPQELAETKQLLNTCGRTTAVKKAIMVARLEQELKVYKADLVLLNELKKASDEQYRVADWEELLALERQRGESLERFVGLQGDIIDSLMAGNNTESDSIQDLTGEVLVERESYATLKAKIKELRDSF